MSAPRDEFTVVEIQNPHASLPLRVPAIIAANTSEDEIAQNITLNSQKPFPWLQLQKEHDRHAVIIGGGASVDNPELIDQIKQLQVEGAVVFTLNAASQWARSKGIRSDVQIIVDAKRETAELVDPDALVHYFASQCNPATFAKVQHPVLWHLEIGDVEKYAPSQRVKKGGYVLIGGGVSVGISGMCVVYSQGFRKYHLFGFDSCHLNGRSHAYAQPMNDYMPCTTVKWAGREFYASLAMKAQAEKFQITAQALKQAGCEINVYGDGLLQAMWNTAKSNLSEREKYQLMWQFDAYREFSPGEQLVDLFVDTLRPTGLIVDFGCGTGRAGLKLAQMGCEVLLSDFAENCRDQEAMSLPFVQWDLTKPHPARAKFGLCTDVMEHIPTDDVERVLLNIMNAAENVMFQICTAADHFGMAIGHPLHLTVQEHQWWKDTLDNLGLEIQAEIRMDERAESIFFVKNPRWRGLTSVTECN